MSQTCTQCSHVNPADASYCYYDGVRLAGGAGGPVNAGAQNFPAQFVFPSGLVCRNFDQFATTCQQNWQAAVSLLKDGMFANFFGGMGRTDLAMAAKEAARFPDLDRGFDQFLAKLPTNTLQDPKLKVEPTEVNLGQMSYGTDRTLELRLENAGMRLIYGSVASDSKWLTLGDAPGNQQKLFQFGTDVVIPLQIRGKDLRASPKPLVGQLLIESNAGPSITVTVTVTVPIVPFKEGVLAGSKSPREIAEKARPKAAEAAQYFENGAIADWFKRNGWIYPVQGPSAVGMGAVQQFFEALGLAKPPKVDISVKSLTLSGAPGESASANIEVTTQEKKMVYAHATCEQPWVDVSKVKLAGRIATITVSVPNIPSRPGETLQTKVHIAGNGNQRFSVPLSVTVGGSPVAAGAPPMAPTPMPAANPFAFNEGAPSPAAPSAKTSPSPAKRDSTDEPDVSKKRSLRDNPVLMHLIPLGVLMLGLLIVLIRDLVAAPPPIDQGVVEDDTPVEKKPKVVLLFDWGKNLTDDETDEVELQKMAHRNMNFGIITNQAKKSKRLFFHPRGATNNTLLKIDDAEYTFGKPGQGEWDGDGPVITGWGKAPEAKDRVPKWVAKEGIGTWKIKSYPGLSITQNVRVIPGESVETDPEVFKRYSDTVEVTYRIVNHGKDCDFGMRILLDTLIGDNDGVPFNIPGQPTLIYSKSFSPAAEVPDFIMAYEKETLDNPGVVVQLNLRHSMADRKLESPDKLLLTKWPLYDEKGKLREYKTAADLDNILGIWNVPLADPREAKPKPDSAIVLYWNPKPLKKGETRDLGYTYSLSSAAASAGGKLSMSAGGSRVKDGEVSVIAMVSNAKEGETVKLELPRGLSLLPGNKLTQDVPDPVKGPDGKLRASPITWRLRADMDGAFTIRARSSTGASQAIRIFIRPRLVL